MDTAGRPGYRGSENVPVTDELTQAAIYAQLVRTAACDPDVAELSFFGFRDDGLRTGFQAGLAARGRHVARRRRRQCKAAIADAELGCAGRTVRWRARRARSSVRASRSARSERW